MLGSVSKQKTLSTSEWYGETAECEICGEVKRCTEQYEILICQSCRLDFLPPEGLL